MAYTEFRLGGGLNLFAHADAIGDDELVIADGVAWDKLGGIRRELGREILETALDGGVAGGPPHLESVTGIVEATIDDGNTYLFLENKKRWVRTDFDGANQTTIFVPALGANHPFSGVGYKEHVYLFARNGRRYSTADGIEKIGLNPAVDATPPPASTALPPTVASEGVAGAGSAGQVYKWVVTFYNGVAESNFSDPTPPYTIVGASGVSVNLTIPLGLAADNNEATTARRIYRTLNNGETYFFVGEVADNVTTVFNDPLGLVDNESDDDDAQNSTDEDVTTQFKTLRGVSREACEEMGGIYKQGARVGIPSTCRVPISPSDLNKDKYDQDTRAANQIIQTNLGLLANWNDHDPPPATDNKGLRNIVLHNNTLYAIVADTDLVFSSVGNAEYWPIYNRVPVGRKGSIFLKTIHVLGDDLICYTNRSIWRFRNLGLNATESTLEIITDDIGVVSEQAVVETERHGHIIFSKDGIYQLQENAPRPEKISHAIDPLFNDPTHSHYVDKDFLASVTGDGDDDVLYFSYNTGEVGDFNTRTIRLDLRDGRMKWAVSRIPYSTIRRVSDGRILAGNEMDDLMVIDSPTPSAPGEQITFRTKSFPIRSAMSGEFPEIVVLDADIGPDTASVSLWGDDDASPFATYSITGSGRQKHRRLVPFTKHYDRIALRVDLIPALDESYASRFYGVAFQTDEAAID